MRRLGLRAKLLASFILILLPVLGLLLYGYREANERGVEAVLDDQMQTAQAVAALVDAKLDEAFALAWALTIDPLVYTFDPSQLDPHLQSLAPRYPQYEAISIINSVGDNVGSSLPFPPGTQRIGLATGRPYFQQLMATGEPVISEVLVSRRTLRPTIIVTVPLSNEDGKTIGAVLLTLYLETLSRGLESVALRPEQNMLLADNVGTAAFQTAIKELPWEERNLSEFVPVKAALEGSPTKVRRFTSPLTGDTRIGAFTPTSKYGWVVGVTVPEDVALAPVRTALRDQLLGFGAVAVLTVGIAFLASRALLRPILGLTDAALALGRGDLTRRVDIKTRDEMEDLGSTFNRMAERLARTLTDLWAVLDSTESGILMYDRNLAIRLLNRRMCDWFNLDPTQVVGQPVVGVRREHVEPRLDQPEKLLARLDWLREHPEETILEEIEVVRPDYRILRLYIGPVRADSKRIGYIEVYTDITALRRRENERQALGQIAEALVRERTLERVAEVVVEQGQHVFRTNTVELFLADAQREELRLVACRGLSPATVAKIGTIPFGSPSLTALAARTGEFQAVHDITTLGPDLTLARRIAEQEGQRSIFSQPLFARDRLVGVLTFATPVHHHLTEWEHEFLRAFADLCAVTVENARLYEELRETLHLREEFLSAAAHELKTPLASLRGYAQLLLRSKALRPPDEHQALEVIERQTRRITRLAEDLLETVSPSARPLVLQTVDLAALAEEELQEAARASARHRLMLCRPGPVLSEADPDLIRRVMLTLLDNAIRFSPQGGGIEATVMPEDGTALVSVRDYGLGIPKERQRNVFEPFYEPFPSGTPGYYGATGLGLFVVKAIVERHGGRMWFESEEGKGSTFYFSLPSQNENASL